MNDSVWDKLERRITEVWSWARKSGAQLAGSRGARDLIVRLGGRFSSLFNYAFAKRNFICYGPSGVGKTSLIGYLDSGRASVDSHDPTSGLAIIDRAFEVDRAEWLKVLKDAGGDPNYRYLWPRLTKEIDPDAIIYLLDGRKSLVAIRQDLDSCLQDSISQYQSGGRLKLIYVFVNFYDIWASDREKRALLLPQVNLWAAEWKFKYPVLERVVVRAFQTHISPYATAWSELDNALEHLATDLRAYRA